MTYLTEASLTPQTLTSADIDSYRDIRLEAMKTYPGAFLGTPSEFFVRSMESLRGIVEGATNPTRFTIGAFTAEA